MQRIVAGGQQSSLRLGSLSTKHQTVVERCPLLKSALHRAVHAYQVLRRSIWFISRPATFGVHAIPLTPAGNLVLVRLSYAKGWRLPGGGRKRGEEAPSAIVRELKEEIGLLSYANLERVASFELKPDYRRDQSQLFVLRDVLYRPKWSLEISEVQEFSRLNLPSDTAPITRRLLAMADHMVL